MPTTAPALSFSACYATWFRTASRWCPPTEKRASLLEAWTGAATAIVIDAVAGGHAAPGTLHRLVVTADQGPLPDRGASSHELGVGTAVALGSALGRLPGRLIVHGIQGADFGQGVTFSPAVAERIGDLAAAVLADIRAAAQPRSRSG